MRQHLLAFLVPASLLCGTPLLAQQPAAAAAPVQPGIIVVSYNKCGLDAPAKLDSIAAQVFYPALDELVRERRLLGWGVLTHAWGDEWNYVIYYSAADLPAFHSAWGELIRRVQQRGPAVMSDLARLCTEHRDNIYGVMRLGATPPPS